MFEEALKGTKIHKGTRISKGSKTKRWVPFMRGGEARRWKKEGGQMFKLTRKVK